MMNGKKNKKNSNATGRVCNNCLAPERGHNNSNLSACARCGLVTYCSKECQREHWKANHKQYCVSKADRVPGCQEATKGADSDAATTGEKCAICQDLLIDKAALTLVSCAHVFHVDCVAELRKLGVKQLCPLCRTPLPPGPEKVFEEASRRYMVIRLLVDQGHVSWSELPASVQRGMDAVIAGWRAAAEEGLASAQYDLGDAFDDGRGVAQSDVEAARWWQKAAEQGHVDAQYHLGAMFMEGRGVAQSFKEAAKWTRMAADRGNVDAQCELGQMYEEGSGVAQSDEEAVKWSRKAADRGDACAQCELGQMYEEGSGVAQSDEEAVKWYRKAADQGYSYAKSRLAILP